MADEQNAPPLDAPTATIPTEAARLPPVTTATEWKRKARSRWRVSLPSGAVIEARRPDFTAMIGTGVIDPQLLLAVASDVTNPMERYASLLPMARAAAPQIATYPQVVASPDGDGADTISVEDIPIGDLIALFLWAGGWNTTLPCVEIISQ